MTQNPPAGWNPGGPEQPWQPQGPGPQFQGPQPNQPQNQPPWPPQHMTPQPQYPPQGQPQHQQQWQPQGQPQYQQPWPPQGAPVKAKSKVPLIVASVLALALVAGGIVFALNFFRGATPGAAKGLPGDVAFAAVVNLAPSANDQLQLARIVNKFPVPEKMSESKDFKEALWNLIPDSDGKPDFEKIKPWLGNSIAIALKPKDAASGSGEPVTVISVETTNQKLAEEFVKSEFPDATVFFIDHLMVITRGDDGITAESITKAPLSENPDFKADLARAGSGSLLMAWFRPALLTQLANDASSAGLPAGNIELLKDSHGVLALKVAENELLADAWTVMPNAPEAKANDIRTLVDALPGNTLGTFGASLPRESFEQFWESLQQSPDFLEQLREFGIESGDDLAAVVGKEIGISLQWNDETMSPAIGVVSVSENQAKQIEILQRLRDSAAGSQPGLEFEQAGDKVYIGFGQSPAAVKEPSTRLGDQASFKKAVNGSGNFVYFVDFKAFTELPMIKDQLVQQPDVRQWLDPLGAFGLSGKQDGKEVQVKVKITFN